jgi:hypothetical protein
VSEVRAEGCLRVSSATLRSIGLEGNHFRKMELVIEDAPRLKRLLLPRGNGCRTIRIMRAPKLEILGPFSRDFSKIQVFKVSTAKIQHSHTQIIYVLMFIFSLSGTEPS